MLPSILRAASDAANSTAMSLAFVEKDAGHGAYRVARGRDGAEYGYGPVDGRDRVWRRSQDGVFQTLSAACNPLIAERFLDLVHHRATDGLVMQARWPVIDAEGVRSIETVPVVLSRSNGGLTFTALAIGAGKVDIPAEEVSAFLGAGRPGRVSGGVEPRAQTVFDEQLLALARMAPGILSPGENLQAALGQTRIRSQMGGKALNAIVNRRLAEVVDTLARGLDGQVNNQAELSGALQAVSDLRRGRAAEALSGHAMALVVAELEPALRACGAIYAAAIEVAAESEGDEVESSYQPR